MCKHCTGDCDCTWVFPLKVLLDQGLDINGRTLRGESALLVGARFGLARVIVTLLSRKARIDASMCSDGWTALHESAQLGRLDVCKVLLEHAASLDAESAEEGCVQPNRGTAFFANLATDRGSTPLLEAATAGHDAVVGFLLANLADVNLKRDTGRTPLMLAAEIGSPTLCQSLLEARCQVCEGVARGPDAEFKCFGRCLSDDHKRIKDCSGRSAFELAVATSGKAKHEGPARLYEKANATVKLLRSFNVK